MNLDELILQSYGGVENNSLKDILQLNRNNDNNVDIIQHSQYYDDDNFLSVLKSKKMYIFSLKYEHRIN